MGTPSCPNPANGIYALYPAPPAKQLPPLAGKEITRLFAEITRREVELDESVDSSIRQSHPDWTKDPTAEQEVFPASPYYGKKLDPHLMIVEPRPED